MNVEFILSEDALREDSILKGNGISKLFYENIKEFRTDMENRYNQMVEFTWKPKRYKSHYLLDERDGFNYVGYIGSCSFDIDHYKNFRIIWKVLYDKKRKIDSVSELSQELQDEWNSKKDDNLKLIYITRLSVEYHHGRDTSPDELTDLLKDIKDSFIAGLVALHEELKQKVE